MGAIRERSGFEIRLNESEPTGQGMEDVRVTEFHDGDVEIDGSAGFLLRAHDPRRGGQLVKASHILQALAGGFQNCLPSPERNPEQLFPGLASRRRNYIVTSLCPFATSFPKEASAVRAKMKHAQGAEREFPAAVGAAEREKPNFTEFERLATLFPFEFLLYRGAIQQVGDDASSGGVEEQELLASRMLVLHVPNGEIDYRETFPHQAVKDHLRDQFFGLEKDI
jgi:hypothetical protein